MGWIGLMSLCIKGLHLPDGLIFISPIRRGQDFKALYNSIRRKPPKQTLKPRIDLLVGKAWGCGKPALPLISHNS